MAIACRLYVLTAAKAPLALVLRRGPTGWWHLMQWDLEALTLTPGAWFHGYLYPRRCDISADGRLFGYYTLKMTGAHQGWPDAFFAVSKAPWLQALAAWKTCGTWTWGCQFLEGEKLSIQAAVEQQPFHGTYPHPFSTSPMGTDWPKRDVWNEMKRGWLLSGNDDPLVAPPSLAMRRKQPGRTGGAVLGLIHKGVNFRKPGMEGVQLEYFLQESPNDVTPLVDAVWADWDHDGRLLMATRSGTLEILECQGTTLKQVWSVDLRDRTPDPQPAPDWASHW